MNEAVQTWFPVAQWIICIAALALALWFRVTARDEAQEAVGDLRVELTKVIDQQRADQDKLEKTVIDHDRRLIAVEKAMEYFPTSRDIAKLGDKLAEMSGDMKRMSQELVGLHEGQKRQETAMGVINETLLHRNHK